MEKQGVKSSILVITQSPVVCFSKNRTHAVTQSSLSMRTSTPIAQKNKNVPRFLFFVSPKGLNPSLTAGVGEELHAEPPWRSGPCLPPPETTLQEQIPREAEGVAQTSDSESTASLQNGIPCLDFFQGRMLGDSSHVQSLTHSPGLGNRPGCLLQGCIGVSS